MLYHQQWLGTKKRIDFCGVQVLPPRRQATQSRAVFAAAAMVWSMALLYCLAIIDLNVLFYLLFLSFAPHLLD